jgi:hypothetical protein
MFFEASWLREYWLSESIRSKALAVCCRHGIGQFHLLAGDLIDSLSQYSRSQLASKNIDCGVDPRLPNHRIPERQATCPLFG